MSIRSCYNVCTYILKDMYCFYLALRGNKSKNNTYLRLFNILYVIFYKNIRDYARHIFRARFFESYSDSVHVARFLRDVLQIDREPITVFTSKLALLYFYTICMRIGCAWHLCNESFKQGRRSFWRCFVFLRNPKL